MKTKMLFAIGLTLSLSAFAQTNSQTNGDVEHMDHMPTFHVTVISRSVQAVNYKHRSGSSKLDFAGTSLMPSANGVAEVNSKRGSIAIQAEFGDLQKPTVFGNEYLTYILWAISPEGRAVNLGEVLVGGNHRSKLNVTTDLQAFALIVTAEPYYAVRQPSNLVVLENIVRDDTKGTTEAVNAKYELMERGGYIPTGYKFDPVVLSANLPLEFYEARNALRIAQSEGAEQYAGPSYKHATELMNHADEYATRKHIDKKPLIAVSREAVETAEDARQVAVKKMDEVRLANERQDSADAQARTQDQANDAMRQKSKRSPTRRERRPQRLKRKLTLRMPAPPRLRQNRTQTVHVQRRPRRNRTPQTPVTMPATRKPQPPKRMRIWQPARLRRQRRSRRRKLMRKNLDWRRSSRSPTRNRRILTRPPCARSWPSN